MDETQIDFIEANSVQKKRKRLQKNKNIKDTVEKMEIENDDKNIVNTAENDTQKIKKKFMDLSKLKISKDENNSDETEKVDQSQQKQDKKLDKEERKKKLESMLKSKPIEKEDDIQKSKNEDFASILKDENDVKQKKKQKKKLESNDSILQRLQGQFQEEEDENGEYVDHNYIYEKKEKKEKLIKDPNIIKVGNKFFNTINTLQYEINDQFEPEIQTDETMVFSTYQQQNKLTLNKFVSQFKTYLEERGMEGQIQLEKNINDQDNQQLQNKKQMFDSYQQIIDNNQQLDDNQQQNIDNNQFKQLFDNKYQQSIDDKQIIDENNKEQQQISDDNEILQQNQTMYENNGLQKQQQQIIQDNNQSQLNENCKDIIPDAVGQKKKPEPSFKKYLKQTNESDENEDIDVDVVLPTFQDNKKKKANILDNTIFLNKLTRQNVNFFHQNNIFKQSPAKQNTTKWQEEISKLQKKQKLKHQQTLTLDHLQKKFKVTNFKELEQKQIEDKAKQLEQEEQNDLEDDSDYVVEDDEKNQNLIFDDNENIISNKQFNQDDQIIEEDDISQEEQDVQSLQSQTESIQSQLQLSNQQEIDDNDENMFIIEEDQQKLNEPKRVLKKLRNMAQYNLDKLEREKQKLDVEKQQKEKQKELRRQDRARLLEVKNQEMNDPSFKKNMGQFLELEAELGSDNEENDDVIKQINKDDIEEQEGANLDRNVKDLIDDNELNLENEDVNWDKFHMDLMKQDKEELKKVLKGAYNFRQSAGKNFLNEDETLDENQKKKLQMMEERMNQLEKADNIYGLGEKINDEEDEKNSVQNSQHDSLIDDFEFINNFKKWNKKKTNIESSFNKKFDENEHLDHDTLIALNKLQSNINNQQQIKKQNSINTIQTDSRNISLFNNKANQDLLNQFGGQNLASKKNLQYQLKNGSSYLNKVFASQNQQQNKKQSPSKNFLFLKK